MVLTGVAAPARDADRRAELERVLDALSPRVTGPRLALALGRPPRTACHVLDAKYEPGQRCTLLYRVGSDLVRADLDVGELDVSEPEDGDRAVPGLRLFRFPEDPDLRTLPTVLAPGGLAAQVAAAVGEDPGRARPATLLRYRPGKRVTVGVHLRGRSSPGPDYVAKVYHRASKAAAVAASRALADDVPAGDPRLALAPVVAHLVGLDVVVQGAVRGRPLPHVLLLASASGSAGATGPVARAATGLALLHRHSLAGARRRDIDIELDRFARRGDRVAAVAPRVGGALLTLAARLHATRSAVTDGGEGLVHGDCKPSQFLLTPDGVVLLDLDHCGVADQASDVATFVASLRQLALRRARRGLGGATAERLGAAFLDAYVAAADLPGRATRDLQRRVRWYEAVALERKAVRAFARAPASSVPLDLVHEAHRQLDRLQGEDR